MTIRQFLDCRSRLLIRRLPYDRAKLAPDDYAALMSHIKANIHTIAATTYYGLSLEWSVDVPEGTVVFYSPEHAGTLRVLVRG